MTQRCTSADTRAAQAALARLSVQTFDFDRYLLVDDSDEDTTQILSVMTPADLPNVEHPGGGAIMTTFTETGWPSTRPTPGAAAKAAERQGGSARRSQANPCRTFEIDYDGEGDGGQIQTSGPAARATGPSS